MMSSYETYFNILPSDLCAASNFRHLYLFLASSETLLSLCTSGLALTLSVAMYTHQHFIERHTNNHPFVQATTFLVAGVTLAIKSAILAALTWAIALNDAEIFVACTEEDLLQESDSGLDTKPSSSPPPPAYSWRDQSTSIPGPYTCDSHRDKSLYSSVHRIAISSHRQRHMSVAHDPTEKARKCFQRRQACLYRQRNMLAPFPIIQLLCGAISMVFWFSIDDSSTGEGDGGSVKDLLESQMPSLHLFNGYLILWTVCLVHSPFFLLVSTWHFARVDWQMQILAVHQFLNRSDERSKHDDSDAEDCWRSNKTRSVCPCCHRKKTKSLVRQKDKIRNSRTLQRALRKADQLNGTDAVLDLDEESSCTTLSSEQASQIHKRDNRIAALSALTRQRVVEDAEVMIAERRVGRRRRRKSSVDSITQMHRSHLPYSVPVSPDSLSFIMTGSGSNRQTYICNLYDEQRRESGSLDNVGDFRLFTTIGRKMSKDSTSSSSEQHASAHASRNSIFEFDMIQNPRPASIADVPILKPIIRSNDHGGVGGGGSSSKKDNSTKTKHVSFPAQAGVDVDAVPSGQRALNSIDSVRYTNMMTPMTAISEESSGASSFGSVLLQTPQRAVLLPAPRSAQAEMVRFDRVQ
jgi:hypothetical protein